MLYRVYVYIVRSIGKYVANGGCYWLGGKVLAGR